MRAPWMGGLEYRGRTRILICAVDALLLLGRLGDDGEGADALAVETLWVGQLVVALP